MKKRPTRWTDIMDEYLLTKRAKGEPFHDIASTLGVNRVAVMRRYGLLCKQLGLKRYEWRNGKHSHETRVSVVRMKMEGRKLTEIAAIVGLHVNQTYGIWHRWRTSA